MCRFNTEVYPALISHIHTNMAKLFQLALAPVAASAIFTPQGERSADCVVQMPDTAVVKSHDTDSRRRGEDELAWAWENFMDIGDHEWLPRMLMAKAVMKAMQALEEYTTQKRIAEARGRASKCGWTTWMVGAAAEKCTWCPKVEAPAPILPVVPDLRNSVHHMWLAYGGFAVPIYEGLRSPSRHSSSRYCWMRSH